MTAGRRPRAARGGCPRRRSRTPDPRRTSGGAWSRRSAGGPRARLRRPPPPRPWERSWSWKPVSWSSIQQMSQTARWSSRSELLVRRARRVVGDEVPTARGGRRAGDVVLEPTAVRSCRRHEGSCHRLTALRPRRQQRRVDRRRAAVAPCRGGGGRRADHRAVRAVDERVDAGHPDHRVQRAWAVGRGVVEEQRVADRGRRAARAAMRSACSARRPPAPRRRRAGADGRAARRAKASQAACSWAG